MKGQNLFDIALQECGNVEAAFDLALENDMSVTDLLNPDSSISLPNVVKNAKVVNTYSSQGLNPASENRGVIGSAIGVNFWTIGEDFTVIK